MVRMVLILLLNIDIIDARPRSVFDSSLEGAALQMLEIIDRDKRDKKRDKRHEFFVKIQHVESGTSVECGIDCDRHSGDTYISRNRCALTKLKEKLNRDA